MWCDGGGVGVCTCVLVILSKILATRYDGIALSRVYNCPSTPNKKGKRKRKGKSCGDC